MNKIPTPAEVLSAMITPAVLISAAGTLVLSTSNRLSRVVDRIRAFAAEAEISQKAYASNLISAEIHEAKRHLIADQIVWLSKRLMLLRSAMTTLYAAIGLLVTTSIAVGFASLFQWRYGWIPVVLGIMGAGALLYSSVLLVQEARIAIRSTLHELAFLREAVSEHGKQRNPAIEPSDPSGNGLISTKATE